MYDTLLDLYKLSEIDSDALEVAVTRGWITKVEKLKIMSSK